jgi:hypothetical protein
VWVETIGEVVAERVVLAMGTPSMPQMVVSPVAVLVTPSPVMTEVQALVVIAVALSPLPLPSSLPSPLPLPLSEPSPLVGEAPSELVPVAAPPDPWGRSISAP